MEKTGGGKNVALRTDRKPAAVPAEKLRVNMVSLAGTGNKVQAPGSVRPGKEMAEQEIACNNISQKYRGDGFRQSGMAPVDPGIVPAQGGGAGIVVADPALP